MDIRIEAMSLSPLGLLVVALTSLPGYLLITVAMFLDTELFLSLLGALFTSHILDRFITEAFQAGQRNVADKMQRQGIDILNQAMPGFGETVVNPSMRRLTSLLGIMSAKWFSQSAGVVSTTCFILGLYVAYVEQAQSVSGILLGVATGLVASAPFVYVIF